MSIIIILVAVVSAIKIFHHDDSFQTLERTHRQTDTQTHRHTDTQTHRQTDRQTDRGGDEEGSKESEGIGGLTTENKIWSFFRYK